MHILEFNEDTLFSLELLIGQGEPLPPRTLGLMVEEIRSLQRQLAEENDAHSDTERKMTDVEANLADLREGVETALEVLGRTLRETAE